MSKPHLLQWHSTPDGLKISISAVLFPQEPVLATCCVYLDSYYVWLDLSPDAKRYTVALMPKLAEKNGKPPCALAGEFQNELLSNALRYKIAARNQKIRESVVTEALFFSKPRKEQARVCKALTEQERQAPA